VTRLYLVRHGETDWNATERCQGTADVPLNACGMQQAEALATTLRDVRFDAAYTSPLVRARRTGEIILEGRNVVATTVADLCEMSYGAWQGSTPDEWPGDARSVWMTAPWEMTFPGGESLAMVRRRVEPAIEQIVKRHPGATVLVSGHGHANRAILIGAGYCEPESFWDIAQPNGGVWTLDYEDGHTHASLISQLPVHTPAADPQS
jgi:broad specificity phosphatase PhoE